MREKTPGRSTEDQPENSPQQSPLEVNLSPGFSVRLDGVPVLGWRHRSDEVLAFLILTTERDPIPVGTIAAALNVDDSRVRHAIGDLRQRVGAVRIYHKDRRVQFQRAPEDTVDLWDYVSLAQRESEPELLEQAVSFWRAGVLHYEAEALANVNEQKRQTSHWAWLYIVRMGKRALLEPYRRTFERAITLLTELQQPPTSQPAMLLEPPTALFASVAEDLERSDGEENTSGNAPADPGPLDQDSLLEARALLFEEVGNTDSGTLLPPSARSPLWVWRTMRVAALLGAVVAAFLLISPGVGRKTYTPGARVGQSPDTRYIEARARVARYLELGAPVEPVQEYPDGSTQRFQGGAHGPGLLGAANSARTAFWIDGEIYKKYLQPLGQFDTEPLKKRLGYPKSDIVYEPNSTFHHTGVRALFDHGLIAYHTNGRHQGKAFAIEGGIYQLFSTYGLGSPALGYPISDEENNSSGARESRFEGAIITSIDDGKSYQIFPHPQRIAEKNQD